MHGSPAPGPLVELLRTRRDAIVAAFQARARRLPSGTRGPLLLDHVPAILDALADAARRGEPLGIGPELPLDGDADPDAIVSELGALRRAIHDENERAPRPLPTRDLGPVDDALDEAIAATLARGRRAHEQALEDVRSREERLRMLFDHSPAAMFIKDAEGRLVMANRKCAIVLGHASPDEIVGRLEHEIVPREVADAHLANDRLVLERRQTLEVEEWVPYEGETRTFLSIKFPARGPGAQDFVCGVATDITDQKRAEQGQRFLAEAGRILAESLDFEDTLRRVARLAIPTIGEACTIDVLEAGALRRLVFVVDPSMQEPAGALAAEGPPPLDSNRAVPVAIRRRASIFVPVLDDTALDELGTPEPIRRVLRSLQMQSVMVVPLVGRSGVLGALSLGSVRRRYGPLDLAVAEGLARVSADAIENAHLYREAQDATRHREEVLAVVSHDLRSPLATVRATAQAIGRQPSDEACARHVEVILRAGQRMERMIDDLLQAAAIRAGHLAVTLRPERLSQLAAEAADNHEALAEQHAIRIARAFSAEPTEVLCDRDRVLQVLSNLLGNALKFCRPGDTITLGVQPQDGEVRVSVQDTGPGIETHDLARLFDPYWSALRHEHMGTGLGLYISKGLVEAHGGRMGVESRVGHGSTFWFTVTRS